MQETARVLLKWSLLGETGAAIRKHGFRFPYLAALRSYYRVLNVWHESRFDDRYGVKTGFIVAADELAFDVPDAQNRAVRYRPTPPFTIMRDLRELRRLSGLDFAKETFVDYGCGAGRVMIIAAESGFASAIGIELSPALVETCESNIARYTTTKKRDCNLVVLRQNAMTYEPPDDATVFFFFVPFDAEVYEAVMLRIRGFRRTVAPDDRYRRDRRGAAFVRFPEARLPPRSARSKSCRCSNIGRHETTCACETCTKRTPRADDAMTGFE